MKQILLYIKILANKFVFKQTKTKNKKLIIFKNLKFF